MAVSSGALQDVTRFEEYLDRAADEVFTTMMGVPCLPLESMRGCGREAISAVIGLAGALSGSMVLHCSAASAMQMAEKLTGMAPNEVDAMVRDAIGEVCNMLAGAWKGFDPVFSSGCLLSTPTVVAGSSYELFSQRASVHLERAYRFEAQTFTVTACFELNS